MCGILGHYSAAGVEPLSVRFMSALDSLRVRGPDDGGTYHDECITLGHRRLAVVDLSPAGHQPMESTDHRHVIVFNGEIYNHRELRNRLSPRLGWRSNSDTETLLEAYRTWGVDCLAHLNGMFAFAVWDRTDRTLFVARDRVGVKPLYYSDIGGEFRFASRPRALMSLLDSDQLQFDSQALREYLDLGYIPAPLTIHRGIRKLPAGHYLLINERGARRVRYWDFRAITPDPTLTRRSDEDMADELESLIHSAVHLRLLSDVPLGAFLSGGVDSALVVAAMRSAGVTHPKAFTIGFQERAFDEGPAAAAVARHLGVDHIHETLTVNSLLELMPTYIEEYDEPFADSSAFPTLAVTRLARRHVTVALSGDGADELFGGYHYYPALERLQGFSRLSWKTRHQLAAGLRRLPWHRANLLAGALQCADSVALFHFMRSIGKDYPSLLTPDVQQSTQGSAASFEQLAASFAVDLGAAETGMRLDAGLTLPDLYLQKVDVATMAYSLEARCPMTDYRLVEWAMRLPLHFKIRNGQSKYLLKKVLCRHLPAERVHRPKMGFGVPIAQWLRGPLRSWAYDLIHDESLMSRLPLDSRRVRDLLNQQSSGERESHPLLWSVLMLLCFVRRHGERAAQPVRALRNVA